MRKYIFLVIVIYKKIKGLLLSLVRIFKLRVEGYYFVFLNKIKIFYNSNL